jgi:hypothetical protein
MTPLAERYPGNPIFQLTMGDLNAKLGRKQLAEPHYRAAAEAAAGIPNPNCREKIKQLAQESLAALGQK